MAELLKENFANNLEGWRCKLIEFGWEADHVHILFEAHPALDLSRLINSLKTASSRVLRNRFGTELAQYYRVPKLWHGAYFIGSTGSTSLDTIKTYVQRQGAGRWPTLPS